MNYLKIQQVILLTTVMYFNSCSEDAIDAETSSDSSFTVSSIAIEDGELLEDYMCEEKVAGVENSIPLSWSNVPEGATSLAVSMTHYPDPDDLNTISSYLLLWDIDTGVSTIPYGTADEGPWFMGTNKDENNISYSSPCSRGPGVHEYTITVYALSETPSSLPTESSLDVTYDVFTSAISSVTVIDTATLTFEVTTL